MIYVIENRRGSTSRKWRWDIAEVIVNGWSEWSEQKQRTWKKDAKSQNQRQLDILVVADHPILPFIPSKKKDSSLWNND